MIKFVFLFILPMYLIAEIQAPIGVQGQKGELQGPFNYFVEDDMLHFDKAVKTFDINKEKYPDHKPEEDIDESL